MTIPPFHGNVSFNAHHAPMGAYFTFTCGHFGTRGGLAAQLGKPGMQDIFVGVKLGGRYDPAPIRCLPFFDGARALIQEGPLAFTMDKPDGQTDSLSAYGASDITRHYGWGTDTWQTSDCAFSIHTPFGEIPDPAQAAPQKLRAALLPAVVAELVIDNRQGSQTKTGFFALNFNEGGVRILDEGMPAPRIGFALRTHYGVAAEAMEILDGTSRPAPSPAFNILRWSVQQGLEDRSNPVHLLGSVPGVAVEVPPGKCVALRLALGCYLDGIVTTRLEGRYLYTRHYSGLVDVLNAALDRFPELQSQAHALDLRLLASGLNRDQQFLIAHATRSYYGNTELLEVDGGSGAAPEPYWIVNEGEYCMMNTLDLSVDQMFWELEYNPWVVRNLLDNFLKRYSYHDQVKIPSSLENRGPKLEAFAPGGISFAHDQGVHNQFSPFGASSYELKDLTGCFSYMTQEQLCNWILIAAAYAAVTSNSEWLKSNEKQFDACFQSLRCRGPHRVQEFNSSFCGTGQEITTYDSLDQSLGQACQNLYLSVKTWAAYLGLHYLSTKVHSEDAPVNLAIHGKAPDGSETFSPWDDAESAGFQICRQASLGVLHAIFEQSNAGFHSRILPAVEALIYPSQLMRYPASSGDSASWLKSYPQLISALRTHTISLLSDPQRRNHFPDGGIKLSSTSDNSWLSKIAIVQHVARELFNLDENGKERSAHNSELSTQDSALRASGWEQSDAAHVQWLTQGESAYWAASDQMISGAAKGSRYYPRLITAALWLNTRGASKGENTAT